MESYDDTSAVAGVQTYRESLKLPLWVTLAVLGLVIAFVAWRELSVISAEHRFEAERQALTESHNAAKAATLARARQALAQQTDEAYRLFGTALGWTVGSAMMRGNHDQIDHYFTELLKHERVRLVLLADLNDTVLASSDHNFRNLSFSKYFPAALLLERNITISPGEGSLKRLVVPVHGPSSAKLGTVLVVYEGPSLRLY